MYQGVCPPDICIPNPKNRYHQLVAILCCTLCIRWSVPPDTQIFMLLFWQFAK